MLRYDRYDNQSFPSLLHPPTTSASRIDQSRIKIEQLYLTSVDKVAINIGDQRRYPYRMYCVNEEI